MTTNKPEVVAIKDSDVCGLIELKPVLRLPHGTRLIRLSDYEALQAAHEEELFLVRQDRDSHFGELVRALERLDALQVECEKLRKDAERYRKCKVIPKGWWLEAMAEAGRKGGRSLDESIDAAIAEGEGARGGGSNARV